MKIAERTMVYIPTWALSAIINNDWSGVDGADKELINNFLASNHGGRIIADGYFEVSSEDEFFSWHPAFGKACTCQEMVILWLEEGGCV